MTDHARLIEWIGALERTPSGRLMLTNLVFAFHSKRPSIEILRALVATVTARWTPDEGRRPDTLVELIADELFASAMFAEPRPPAAPCSRVMDAVILVATNINHRELGFGVEDEVPARLLDLLERGIPPGAATGQIRGRRPLAWVTTTDHLEQLRRDYDDPHELATVVRDRLGLTHYDRDQLLLQVDYPECVYTNLEYAAPTFLEGGAGVIFRARFADDRWGRAVDLATLDDGLPEAVHAPVPFTEEFRIRRIGRPKTDPGFEFNQVLERGTEGWTGIPDDFVVFITARDPDPD
jgi:hypothetical protein